MMVVHCNRCKFDVYIGRTHDYLHFGNPFTSKDSDIASVKVKNRAEAIEAFEQWLTGEAHHDVEPERREWILENLKNLKGKVLGCWCQPLPCHGDVYVKLASIDGLLEF